MYSSRINPYEVSSSKLFESPRNNPISPRPPSSPRNPLESYYFASQQPKNKKEYGLFSKRYLPKETAPSANRSRMTQQNTSMSGVGSLLPQQKLYSEQMLFLLSEEENNTRYFKEKLEAEKTRVSRDFENVRKQIQHILSDLEISFVAELDLVYKDFLGRYSEFKKHMVALREIRRNLLNEIPQEHDDYLTQLNQSRNQALSNRDLLAEIEKDAQLFRTQRIYNQITDLQRQNIGPAKQLASQLVTLGGLQACYYDETATSDLLKAIVEAIQNQAKQAYSEIKGTFIITTQQLIGQDNVLNGLSEYQNRQDDYAQVNRTNFKSADHREIARSFQSPRKQTLKAPQNLPVPEESKKYHRPVSSSSDLYSGISKQSRGKEDVSEVKRNGPRNYHMGNLKSTGPVPFKVSCDQQNIWAQWLQDLSLREITTIDAQHSSEALLCCIFANEGKTLAVGGKDRVLRVYQVATGKLQYTLSGHASSICSLCNHGQLVSSGGDHGCSSLILWDTRTWTTRSRLQMHSAAVTCIVDLQDGIHLATASYDKKIHIVNYRKGTPLLTATHPQAGIACMALSADKQRLITAALNNSLAVWRLSRDGTALTNIDLQHTFVTDSLPCSLRPLTLKTNYFMIGTKDGRLLLLNLLTGQTIRKLSVGTTSLVEIVLLERQNKPDKPLALSCLSKERSLMLTKLQSGANSLVDVRGRLNVEIGCGIGPKVIVSQRGVMAILSQSPSNKQILLYQISLL